MFTQEGIYYKDEEDYYIIRDELERDKREEEERSVYREYKAKNNENSSSCFIN